MSDSWYERTVLPYLLDFTCGMKPIRKQRMKVIPQATGRVLEIGIGTGLTYLSMTERVSNRLLALILDYRCISSRSSVVSLPV